MSASLGRAYVRGEVAAPALAFLLHNSADGVATPLDAARRRVLCRLCLLHLPPPAQPLRPHLAVQPQVAGACVAEKSLRGGEG